MWQRKQGNLQSGVGQGLRYITICKCIKLVYTIPTFLDLEKIYCWYLNVIMSMLWQWEQENLLLHGMKQGLRYITICKCLKMMNTIPTLIDLERNTDTECNHVYAINLL